MGNYVFNAKIQNGMITYFPYDHNKQVCNKKYRFEDKNKSYPDD